MVYVIAEIGFNHGGNAGMAVRMIDAAAEAGAGAVKFQSFRASDLYLPGHELYPVFEAGELSEDDHAKLREAARAAGVDFISTPFSPRWVDVLEKLDPAAYKVASMDVNNRVLLSSIAAKGRKVYLSTGASGIGEAKKAVELLRREGSGEVIVLHCVSNYPTAPQDAMLYMIPRLKTELGVSVGFSDHSLGDALAVAAVALGARVIEKHFTIDKSLPGPDHKISADPAELARLVEQVNRAQAAITPPVGDAGRADDDKKKAMRRGIYAGRDIREGEIVTFGDLRLVRPEVTPLEDLDAIAGKPARRSYAFGEPVEKGV